MSAISYEPMGKEQFAKLYCSVSKRESLDINTSRQETDHLYDTVFWHMCESSFCELETEGLSESEEVEEWQALLSSCGQF